MRNAFLKIEGYQFLIAEPSAKNNGHINIILSPSTKVNRSKIFLSDAFFQDDSLFENLSNPSYNLETHKQHIVQLHL